MAAADYFLKLDGITGESQDAKHKGEIQLQSFSWGETQTAAPGAGGGAGAGKVQLRDLHVVMRVSRASPQLMLACASGQHLKSAVLSVRRAGKEQQEFLVYTLTDVLVTSYATGGTTDEVPVDQVSLAFGRIAVDYRPQKPNGTLDAAVHAAWDAKANRKV